MAKKITDSEIEQIKAGKVEVWKLAQEDFQHGLSSQARKLLHSNQQLKNVSAEDLVQETWLKAWSRRSTFVGTTALEFVKWLLVILKNTFIDFCRKKTNFELSVPSRLENAIGNEKTPSENYRVAEKESRLADLMDGMDQRSRKIVMLKNKDGLKFHEIAKRLDLNLNTVTSIYRRAVIKLRLEVSDSSDSRIFV